MEVPEFAVKVMDDLQAEINELESKTLLLEAELSSYSDLVLQRDAEIDRLRAENESLGSGGGCTLATFGRGDCEHAVGLPGYSVPDQHDGPDDTVDCYGKPNGWCWPCWYQELIKQKDRDIEKLRDVISNKAFSDAELLAAEKKGMIGAVAIIRQHIGSSWINVVLAIEDAASKLGGSDND